MATRKLERARGRAARSGTKSSRSPGAKTRPRAATRKTTAPARAARKKGAAPRRAAPAPAAPPPVPNAIGLIDHHMDYSSHDLKAVKRFYTELLGFTQAEHVQETDYLFIRTGPSSSLGFMPPVPGPPEQWRPPREPALFFFVENVDRAHRELAAKGLSFDQPPTDMPWGHRLAVLRDPEGRRVCLAQGIRR